MTEISSLVSDVTVKGPVTYCSLTMFPLGAGKDGTLDYLTLDEALRNGVVHIAEMSRAGSVPELRLENKGELPILIVDGEELVGAKQNRTANLTVMAPAHTTIVLPVSCVEAGRWRHASDHFAASDRAHFARGRASRAASVSQSMGSSGSRRSDQARVWHDVAEVACQLEAPSPTQAMAAVFERHRTRIQDYVSALGAIEGQVGAMFAIGADVIGFDLFDRRTTLNALLPKLVRSYAVDALDGAEGSAAPPEGEVAEVFLRSAARAKASTYPAVGLGTDIRLAAPGLAGGGLVVDETLVHLAAFAISDDRNGGRVESRGMARACDRRRSMRRR